MNPKDIKGLTYIIGKDKQTNIILDTFLDDVLPDSLGWAGGIRNKYYEWKEAILNFNEPIESTKNLDFEIYRSARVCGGIQTTTAKAINDEIKKGNPLLKNIMEASNAERTFKGEAHTATLIRNKDGSTYVLDYHKTLNPNNPMIYPTLDDWMNERNGQTYDDYISQHIVTFNYKELLEQIEYNTRQLKENIN